MSSAQQHYIFNVIYNVCLCAVRVRVVHSLTLLHHEIHKIKLKNHTYTQLVCSSASKFDLEINSFSSPSFNVTSH